MDAANMTKEVGNAGRRGLYKDVGKIMLGALGIGLAEKAIDGVVDKVKDSITARDFEETSKKNIDHARKLYPELKERPMSELHGWMEAAHTISPKIAKNKVLSASYLKTVNDFGGNVDLSTAKMLSDINKNTASGNSDEYVGSGLKNIGVGTKIYESYQGGNNG